MRESKGFICDRMLIKLARWLRIAGYDVLTHDMETDRELASFSVNTDRTILTRDRGLDARKDADVQLIVSADIDGQLKEFIEKAAYTVIKGRTRCPLCNGELCRKQKSDLEEEEILKIPDKVHTIVETYYLCTDCGKIYWIGGHWKKINERLAGSVLEPII